LLFRNAAYAVGILASISPNDLLPIAKLTQEWLSQVTFISAFGNWQKQK
jgi:hypothetical protein